MFCPRPGQAYDDADTSDVTADDVGGVVSFTASFKYLGSLIDNCLRDNADVHGRVKSAAAAFGALRESVFGSKRIKLATKKDGTFDARRQHTSLWQRVLVPYRGAVSPGSSVSSSLRAGDARRPTKRCVAM